MQKVTICFPKQEKIVEVPVGSTLLEAAHAAGLIVASDCGGKGTCGKCKVRITAGGCGEPLSQEKALLTEIELSRNWRLACLQPAEQGMSLTLWQQDSKGHKQLDGERIDVSPDPVPFLGDSGARQFGVAFDIGTTTIAGYLLELGRGVILASHGLRNPQAAFGADVISRIEYAAKPEGLTKLRQAILKGCNMLIEQLVTDAGIAKRQLTTATCVCNSVISHLLLGIDPQNLGRSPYKATVLDMVTLDTQSAGLDLAEGGRVTVLPNIGGFVGSDTIAVILATQLDKRKGVSLAVDLGTNGEIVLSANGVLYAASTAAGPAFEGVNLRSGMRAAKGAISQVTLGEQDILIETVEAAPPAGLCGSGLISAVASLLAAGAVDSSGRLTDQGEAGHLPVYLANRLHSSEQGTELILVYGEDSMTGAEISLSQKDIRELQLAKGAVSAAIKTLMRQAGVSNYQVEQLLLTGAFGNHVHVESVLSIGLIPELPNARILQSNNAAGYGACMALLAKAELARANTLAGQIRHVELANLPEFQVDFIESLNFPTGRS